MYRLVPQAAQYNVVQGGTRWPGYKYKPEMVLVQGGTNNSIIWRYIEVQGHMILRLNRTGWYVLACTDPYDSNWVCCPAAGFAAAILPCRRQRCIGDYSI
jgi:hypothetical protein